jgi:hypothetical protein
VLTHVTRHRERPSTNWQADQMVPNLSIFKITRVLDQS